MNKGAGNLFVITAPSGAGKTSLGRELEQQVPDIRYSISHTTRPPRPHETEGVDYFFVDDAAFRAMIESGSLMEWAEIHGHYYGTSVSEVERAAKDGVDLILDIEGQGAGQVKAKYPRAVLVFIVAPSFEDMRSRLYERDQDTPEEIERRLANARRELTYLPQFDYVIVNDDFDMAIVRLMSVVFAKRSEREAMLPHLPPDYRA